jgi:hypothetical protein
MNLGRLQQFKDVYDQRVFESKSTLNSMVNSISTNRNTMERIKEEKNELRRQARMEQESDNQIDSNYKSLELDIDIRNKKIAAHIQKEKDLRRLQFDQVQQKIEQRKHNRDIFFLEQDLNIPTSRKTQYVPTQAERMEDQLRINQNKLASDIELLEQLKHESEVRRKYNSMIAMRDSKNQENEILKNLLQIQEDESTQADELNRQGMISKRNKEILAEKEKLSRLQNDIEELKTEVDPQYITERHDELRRLAIERGKYEPQRKENEFLRNMQNDVDESMLSSAPTRFDIPTAEENQEFENKVYQEQENIHV